MCACDASARVKMRQCVPVVTWSDRGITRSQRESEQGNRRVQDVDLPVMTTWHARTHKHTHTRGTPIEATGPPVMTTRLSLSSLSLSLSRARSLSPTQGAHPSRLLCRRERHVLTLLSPAALKDFLQALHQVTHTHAGARPPARTHARAQTYEHTHAHACARARTHTSTSPPVPSASSLRGAPASQPVCV
jgi:hypothetical protein